LTDVLWGPLSKDNKQVCKLKNLIVFGDESQLSENDKDKWKNNDLNLVFYDDVVKKGSEVKERSFYEPKADDVFMLSYTSGTTGNPKGVKLTHKMLIGAAYGVHNRVGKIDENDSYLSYLPAAHVFEQAAFSISLVYGMKVGFYSGNVMQVTKDLAILKPTFFPSVPRLLNSVYGRIKDKLNKADGIKK